MDPTLAPWLRQPAACCASAATPGCCKARPASASTNWRWRWPGVAVRPADADGACGHCDSCHQVEVRTHADLCVLMPETAMHGAGLAADEKAQADIDDKKRKASREIRVEAMRDAVEFAQRTSGRGRGKVVLVYPAERMNNITANALLKTLEEPPGDVRFVLATEAAHQLLPTIRSRCLGHTLPWPETGRGDEPGCRSRAFPPAAPPALLRAAGGRPSDALRLHAAGPGRPRPGRWPKALARRHGRAGGLEPGAGRRIAAEALPRPAGGRQRRRTALFRGRRPAGRAVAAGLARWWRKSARDIPHGRTPFNAGLMLEDLVSEARTALNSPLAAHEPT
jgi:DNA polymerase-3 subunit delta'